MIYRFRKSDDVDSDHLVVSVAGVTLVLGSAGGAESVEVYDTTSSDVASALRSTGVLDEEVVEQTKDKTTASSSLPLRRSGSTDKEEKA